MKWEFQSMTLGQLRSATVIENLNILGSKDWELVSVDGGVAYFKRAISRDISEFKSTRVWRTMTPEEIADRDAKNKEGDQNELSKK